MPRPDRRFAAQVTRGVELLQGKWTVLVLCALCDKSVRFGELRRQIPGASKKALTASLRLLESKKLVLRHGLSTSVLHVEYELAESVRASLISLLEHLAQSASLFGSRADEPNEDPPNHHG